MSPPRRPHSRFLVHTRPYCHLQALSEEGCRNSPGLFLREADETELVKVVKSLDKANTLPGRRGGGSGSSSSSPAWLVSRLTGGGEGTAEEEKSGGRGALGVSPQAVATALVYFLHRLPEPLLTFRRREAFLACEVGEWTMRMQLFATAVSRCYCRDRLTSLATAVVAISMLVVVVVVVMCFACVAGVLDCCDDR